MATTIPKAQALNDIYDAKVQHEKSNIARGKEDIWSNYGAAAGSHEEVYQRHSDLGEQLREHRQASLVHAVLGGQVRGGLQPGQNFDQ